MEIVKTIKPQKGEQGLSNPYNDREFEVRKDEEGEITFFEVNINTKKESKLSKEILKWAVEYGRINYDDISEYIEDLKKPAKAFKKEPTPKAKKVVKKEVGATKTYTGRSKKITSKTVTVLSDNGKGKSKVEDEAGNVAWVTNTTLK